MDFIAQFFSKYSQEKIIKSYRNICTAEAISWLLLFTAMIWIRVDKEGVLPIVYISVMGSIHGLFFTIYLLLTLPSKKIFSWDDEDFVFALLSAFFPLATIWVDKKLAKFNRE